MFGALLQLYVYDFSEMLELDVDDDGRYHGRVIDRYTGGRFDEEALDDERWRGPVQRFGNRRYMASPLGGSCPAR
ncbi:hypothetical protein AKJ09_01777 [Labilithrix luteola]|uniref:Uncharacterized protein n=1 Tax=Labilithrix luteola TaxID=1391654 RepID=A0A0K1PNK9_9BACT|nr:hypothetical protein [Labilithrix luteola]AKU95113.1 hypothetical protein AKJ09_01777 [Labilithrix luteola]